LRERPASAPRDPLRFSKTAGER